MLDADTHGHLLPGDKEKEMIDVDTWEEGDSLASLLTAQVIQNAHFTEFGKALFLFNSNSIFLFLLPK